MGLVVPAPGDVAQARDDQGQPSISTRPRSRLYPSVRAVMTKIAVGVSDEVRTRSGRRERFGSPCGRPGVRGRPPAFLEVVRRPAEELVATGRHVLGTHRRAWRRCSRRPNVRRMPGSRSWRQVYPTAAPRGHLLRHGRRDPFLSMFNGTERLRRHGEGGVIREPAPAEEGPKGTRVGVSPATRRLPPARRDP